MTGDLFLVVMAGGSGTRFWPKSTSKRPKQLLSFGAQSHTLLIETLNRFHELVPAAQSYVVTTQGLEQAVRQQLDDTIGEKIELADVKILAEPQGRNTAPCIFWAAKEIEKINPKAVMMVMPSDHFIAAPNKFVETVKKAAEWAREKSHLVTLGVKPNRPETGYGYLKTGQTIATCKQVEMFIEKPSLTKAEEFLRSGQYLWNGGMFLWRVDTILEAFSQSMPEMQGAWKAHSLPTQPMKIEEVYPKLTATSIDYGVMEKAKNVVTFPIDCGWDDLGSWTSLESLADVLQARGEGGVVTGGSVIAVDSESNIIEAPGRLVALLGVKNLIVVEQGRSILVADKSRAQDIRLIVERVKKECPELA